MLTENQLIILGLCLENHVYLEGKTSLEIQQWLDSFGNPDLSNLTFLVTNTELANYLLFRSNGINHSVFPMWVGAFFDKPIVPVMGKTDEEINVIGRSIITQLTNNSIEVNHSLQLIVQEVFSRGLINTIKGLLILVISDGILLESTGYKLLAEIGGTENKKRWEVLGFSELPTVEEIELAL